MGVEGGLVCSGDNGTLGIPVTMGGKLHILSCSHVAARCGTFQLEFPLLSEPKRVIQQQSVTTCDSSQNRIGLITRDYSTLRAGVITTEDCGLILVDVSASPSISSIQRLTGKAITALAQEDPATWSEGMVTRLLGAHRPSEADAVGSVIGLQVQQTISYTRVGDVPFGPCVLYKTRNVGGDSGGAVIDEKNRLLGMHIGGNPDQQIGVFMPLAKYFGLHNLILAT